MLTNLLTRSIFIVFFLLCPSLGVKYLYIIGMFEATRISLLTDPNYAHANILDRTEGTNEAVSSLRDALKESRRLFDEQLLQEEARAIEESKKDYERSLQNQTGKEASIIRESAKEAESYEEQQLRLALEQSARDYGGNTQALLTPTAPETEEERLRRALEASARAAQEKEEEEIRRATAASSALYRQQAAYEEAKTRSNNVGRNNSSSQGAGIAMEEEDLDLLTALAMSVEDGSTNPSGDPNRPKSSSVPRATSSSTSSAPSRGTTSNATSTNSGNNNQSREVRNNNGNNNGGMTQAEIDEMMALSAMYDGF